MQDTPRALDKLYSMLHEAENLGLSRPARMRLIGIIGSLENEELARFQEHHLPDGDDDFVGSSSSDDRFARG